MGNPYRRMTVGEMMGTGGLTGNEALSVFRRSLGDDVATVRRIDGRWQPVMASGIVASPGFPLQRAAPSPEAEG